MYFKKYNQGEQFVKVEDGIKFLDNVNYSDQFIVNRVLGEKKVFLFYIMRRNMY